MKPGKEFVQFKLRVRAELKSQIEELAKDNNRSANAEAVSLLEAALANRRFDKWIGSGWTKDMSKVGSNCSTVSQLKTDLETR